MAGEEGRMPKEELPHSGHGGFPTVAPLVRYKDVVFRGLCHGNRTLPAT